VIITTNQSGPVCHVGQRRYGQESEQGARRHGFGRTARWPDNDCG